MDKAAIISFYRTLQKRRENAGDISNAFGGRVPANSPSNGPLLPLHEILVLTQELTNSDAVVEIKYELPLKLDLIQAKCLLEKS